MEAEKERIRQLFALIEQQYRPQVMKALQALPTNNARLSYLMGWTQVDRGSKHR